MGGVRSTCGMIALARLGRVLNRFGRCSILSVEGVYPLP
jgi:hypothetical protein